MYAIEFYNDDESGTWATPAASKDIILANALHLSLCTDSDARVFHDTELLFEIHKGDSKYGC